MKLQRHVALVGFMGCGKTTVGAELARVLGTACDDTDTHIVQMAGMSIPEIFASAGEKHFRRLETKALRHVLSKAPRVIATGGGMMTAPQNRQLLARHAWTVWLHVPWPVLAARLADSAGERPLLQHDDGLVRAKRLYEERLPMYEAALMRIEADKPPLAVARDIVSRLGTMDVSAGDN